MPLRTMLPNVRQKTFVNVQKEFTSTDLITDSH